MVEFPVKTSPKLQFFYQFHGFTAKIASRETVLEVVVPVSIFLSVMLLYL